MFSFVNKKIAKIIVSSRPILIHYFFYSQVCKKIEFFLQTWALRQADFFSRNDWDEVQLKKMKKILCHAGKNVPYWRKIFSEINFDPKKISSISDIEKIPITNRKILNSIDIFNLVASNVSRNRFIKNFTSGSTGEPFEFYQDREEIFRREINNVQEFRYVDVDLDSPILIIGLQAHTDLDAFGRRINAIDLEDFSKRHNNIYPMISSLRPRLLISTPTSLERFLFFCKKENFSIIIDRICYMGEMMSSDLKQELEIFFNAFVYSTYGTRESSLIGIQCKEKYQHLAPWMNYVEIVDGEIVVTNFENEVMPFIRYSIGDEGELFDSNCKCGRTSKLIKQKGRIAGVIKLSDGSTYYILNVLQYFATELNLEITKFQIEQASFYELNVYYIKKNEQSEIATENKILDYFNRVLKNKIKVSVFCVEYIFANGSGKTPIFISKI